MKLSGCDVAVRWWGKRTEENDDKRDCTSSKVHFMSCSVQIRYDQSSVNTS